jgi:site-specific DNA recombinase
MHKRAMIYCRVSSKEQVQGYSLDVQRSACEAYCNREGWEVDRVFVEAGESAKTADRPELQELLAYVKTAKGRIHYMLVATIDRFARDRFDHAILRRQLAASGVQLRAVSQQIDETAEGELLEGLLSSLAQYENQVKARKVKASMKAAAESGRWPFQPPLGYLQNHDAPGVLVLDSQRAPAIRLAFELIASGTRTQEEVRSELRDRGLRTKKGAPLSRSTFHAMLSNQIYAGRVFLSSWEVDAPARFPSIVPSETFWAVQRQLGRELGVARRSYVHDRDDFPLRGLLRCQACGQLLTASWSKGKRKRYAYYHCPGSARCRKSNVPALGVEAQFMRVLEALRPKPEYLQLFRVIVLDVWKREHSSTLSRRVALEAALGQTKKRRERLDEAYLFEGGIDRETYDRMKGKLADELARLEAQIEELRLDEIDVEAAMDYAIYLATHAERLWLAASAKQRLILQEVFFPEGLTISSGEIRTPATGSFFSQLREITGDGAMMVSPAGFEPALPP